ncbi:hypothetical protein QQP08_014334 [Theobroma cacao]|nr:hypothetical protein QQP08_014334 [Theobroma cacao]
MRIAATTFSLEDNLLRRGSYDLISTPEIDTCICSDGFPCFVDIQERSSPSVAQRNYDFQKKKKKKTDT